MIFPDTNNDLIRYHMFSKIDLSIIWQRCGLANHQGLAVQLCYMRFPGIMLTVEEQLFPPLLSLVAIQLKVPLEA
ncbi:DUF4158 domain-containing protein [Pseudomonas asuensis]|uniref:DUF4158 domain-containing protein n=1 Tax=Pseudomonas asuensis TaxID=1825787 RepID=A0ABQ2H4R6_9PSED|nr:hypothetical protein GCM10009425_48900 [Pseudomonas asuensis]